MTEVGNLLSGPNYRKDLFTQQLGEPLCEISVLEKCNAAF
jgi:hypothetical protein